MAENNPSHQMPAPHPGPGPMPHPFPGRFPFFPRREFFYPYPYYYPQFYYPQATYQGSYQQGLDCGRKVRALIDSCRPVNPDSDWLRGYSDGSNANVATYQPSYYPAQYYQPVYSPYMPGGTVIY